VLCLKLARLIKACVIGVSERGNSLLGPLSGRTTSQRYIFECKYHFSEREVLSK
jgi:hypothetical protein